MRTVAFNLLIALTFVGNIVLAQTSTESCVNNWTGVNYEIPDPFKTMLNSQVTGSTYYIAIDEAGASNSNDGSSPTFQGGTVGPLKDFKGLDSMQLFHKDTVKPGDRIYVRGGTYSIDTTLTIGLVGTPTAPIRLSAYNGEEPIIKGTFDSLWVESILGNQAAMDQYVLDWYHIPLVRFSGENFIMEGFTFAKMHFTGILWKGKNIVLQNSKLIGSVEELIKTTELTRYGLCYKNEFTKWVGEGIDIFGAHHFYNVENTFHGNIGHFPNGWGTGMWSKAGADTIYQVNNTFRDMTVGSHALNMGGCCWNNWTNPFDNQGDPKPVSTNTYALGNRFLNVKIDPNQTYNYKGILTFEAAYYSEARNNLFYECDDAISVRKAAQNGDELTSEHLTITNNYIINQNGGRLYNLIDSYNANNTTIDSNKTFSYGSWTCYATNTGASYAAFKTTFSHDLNGSESSYSSICDSLGIVTSIFEEVEKKKITAFPNPTYDKVFLSEMVDNLIVRNITGEVVLSASGVNYFNLHEFPVGVYFAEIYATNNKTVLKVLKTNR